MSRPLRWFALAGALVAPTMVLAWGTLTGGLNLSAADEKDLKWLIAKYGVDTTLGAQFAARTGSHPIHQFIVQQALAVIAKDPALADGKSGLPDAKAINAWDGIERCEQGMRERVSPKPGPYPELSPGKPTPETTPKPGPDAEIDRSGGWNPTYNGRAHYWNPWTEDGEGPRLAGVNYERLATLVALRGDAGKLAHHAAYLAHYVADPLSAKHADVVSLDAATVTKLVDIAKRWFAAEQDEIEDWIASPIVTEAVDLIEAAAKARPHGAAWLDRVKARSGLIGGSELLTRGVWTFSKVDIARSSLRSAVACYLHELEARPTVAGEVKSLDRFYSYFDPLYFNGPIYNPVASYPSFKICVPLSEHLFWETNPAQYKLVEEKMKAGGSILDKPDPKSVYVPWKRQSGFASFNEKVRSEALQKTAVEMVERCAREAHGDVATNLDFEAPFDKHLRLSVRCVATALRASVTALRGEGWGRLESDGKLRAQLVLDNLADTPATLMQARFSYLDAAGKPHTSPGWTAELGGRQVAKGTPLDVGAAIDGAPRDVPPERWIVDVTADFGEMPDAGLLRVPLSKRETEFVEAPAADTTLVTTKGPVDVIVVMDTTGSMQGSIDSMRDNAISSIRKLREKTDDIRMAVVTFRDLDVKTDEGHFLTSGFTSNLESQFAFMRGLKADGGGDTPEDQLDGLSRAIALWEKEPQDADRVPAKIIVTITDAPAKEPDKAGNTFASIRARAYAVDPAHIYAILVGGDANAAAHAARLAADTGGQVINVKTGTEVADALLAAVDTAVVVHGKEAWSKGGRPIWMLLGAAALLVASIGVGLFALRQGRRARRFREGEVGA